MPRHQIEMGWAARPMKEQHPALPDTVADHLDKDNLALSRLRVRGLIADSEIARIRGRFLKNAEQEIEKALAAQADAPTP